MRYRVHRVIASAVLAAAMVAAAVPGSSQEEGVVQIVIRKGAYEFHGGRLVPDAPATVVLRNLDNVRHGFTSPLLKELPVEIEIDGIDTKSRGLEALHLEPEKSATIHFVPNRAGKFTFKCDLHPDMKGELLLLSVEGV